MSCRVIKLHGDLCEYNPSGIKSIRLIDFEDFVALQFTDYDVNYDANYVTAIYHSGSTVEVETNNSAKYEMTRAAGLNVHTLSAFLTGLAYDLALSLDLSLNRRYVVLFTTKAGRTFVFGSDAGATVSYENQTEGATGSTVTFTAKSRYPLFEASRDALLVVDYDYTWSVDFINRAYCEKTSDYPHTWSVDFTNRAYCEKRPDYEHTWTADFVKGAYCQQR